MEDFLKTFRTRSHSRMSTVEKELFDKSVGYDEELDRDKLIQLYNTIFAWYDCNMDEMKEDEVNDIIATFQLVTRHMKRDWFHLK
jgi:hypothetical protein